MMNTLYKLHNSKKSIASERNILPLFTNKMTSSDKSRGNNLSNRINADKNVQHVKLLPFLMFTFYLKPEEMMMQLIALFAMC